MLAKLIKLAYLAKFGVVERLSDDQIFSIYERVISPNECLFTNDELNLADFMMDLQDDSQSILAHF